MFGFNQFQQNAMADRSAIGPDGGGIGRSFTPPPEQSNGMLQNLLALYGQMGRSNNQSPLFGGHFGLPYDPSQPPPFMPPGVPMANTGGSLPPQMAPMGMPQTGGGLPPMPGLPPRPMLGGRIGPLGNVAGEGYDGSGINPGGMFGGGRMGPPMMDGVRGLRRNLGFGGRR